MGGRRQSHAINKKPKKTDSNNRKFIKHMSYKKIKVRGRGGELTPSPQLAHPYYSLNTTQAIIDLIRNTFYQIEDDNIFYYDFTQTFVDVYFPPDD